MRLFQYWDTGEPPNEMAGWIDRFRSSNPEMKHRLYNRESAAWFIGKHLGLRQRKAFDACAVPAMQADYFRLCALFARGGLWIDADVEPLKPIAGLLDRAPHSLMLSWQGFLQTPVMLFRETGDAFVGAFLDLVTANIVERRFNNVLIATGPLVADALRGVIDPQWAETEISKGQGVFAEARRGLLEHVRARLVVTEALRRSFGAMTIMGTLAAMDHVHFWDPPYKLTATHWTNWKGSIYV